MFWPSGKHPRSPQPKGTYHSRTSANVLLTSGFQISVFSPVFAISSTVHLSQTHSVEVFPTVRGIHKQKINTGEREKMKLIKG